MASSKLRTKVLEEIDLIPEEKLTELYNFIYYFRLGVQTSKNGVDKIMKFASSWKDIPDEMFADLNEEINVSRHQIFLNRRSDETRID
ncbi:MAG: hypothetical protein AAF378_20560 [Cyanobacteria bacterium P01_A01_bin.84]